MTPDGEWLDFQTYFVFRHHTDPVAAVRFDGIEAADPAPGVLEAIAGADAVVLGPSNPILSIWPIIRVPGVRQAIADNGRVLAVSPLIGGAALKGPAVEVLSGLGFPAGLQGVLDAYDGLLTDLVVDDADAGLAAELEGVRVHVSDTRIAAPVAAERLAKEIIAWLA
jgi:LPPG:FO 2-phospho-L-lactate transferase